MPFNTRSAFEALELSSFGRIDFRVDASGMPHIIDVGVSPGLGTGGSAFASVSALGVSYPDFLRAVVAASLASLGLLT
jgi:D-alanine-D-alanine ligase-like ATP-grasp enzyme